MAAPRASSEVISALCEAEHPRSKAMAWRTTALDRKGRPSRHAEARRVKQRRSETEKKWDRAESPVWRTTASDRRSRPSLSVGGASSSSSSAAAAVPVVPAVVAVPVVPAVPLKNLSDEELKAKFGELQDKHNGDLDELNRKQKEVDALTRKIRGAASEMIGIRAELDKRAQKRRRLQAELSGGGRMLSQLEA